MSTETTNTPNGASKYKTNPDSEHIALAITDMSERDPQKDLTGNEPGDNTITEASVMLNNFGLGIEENGSIEIRSFGIGEPMIPDQESKGKIKVSVEQVKNALKAKGALSQEDYIKLKENRLKAEQDRTNEDEEDRDKNNDGIDDRNQ